MIIAVLGEKGGTGKTTVAVNLAGMRAAAGWRVLLLDADRQGSSAYWVAEARDTGPARSSLGSVFRRFARTGTAVRDA